MKKIAIILGTRPEAIKLIPVFFALKKTKNISPLLISTGQHSEMLNQIFNFFDVQPDIDLNLMTHNQGLASLSALMLQKIEEILKKNPVDQLMVQGDTTSAMIASLVGYYNQINVCHVEAGLRTFDKYSPFPEEINRRIIGLTADIHFAPTERAAQQLRSENVRNVYMVGNTVVDSLNMALKIVKKDYSSYRAKFRFMSEERQLILITGHRRESFGEPFENICKAIKTLAHAYPNLDFVYPVHLNPNVKELVFSRLNDLVNIHLIDPLPYDQMVFLMSQAHIILTDSGGIQEEAPTLNVPILVMRETTERPEGITVGCAELCGTAQDDIVNSFKKIHESKTIWSRMSNAKSPYGDGTSSSQISQLLSEELP